jgi:methylated-DNA-[protein]-cysteine S-methyltransferase
MPQIDGPLSEHHSLSFATKFGWFRPISDGANLIRLDWNQTGWTDPDDPDDVSRETKNQLVAYMAGQLRHFTVPTAPEHISPTGYHWLAAMAQIPYGTAVTYGEFAALAGKPGAARAAGSSCANNPIPIIFPCHRVVRRDRSLGNYGGGSDLDPSHPDNIRRKAALIAMEQDHIAKKTGMP